jgi:MFS family permease
MVVRQSSPDNAVRLRRFLIASFMAQTVATAGVLSVPIVLPLARADAGGAALDIGTYVGFLYLTAATSALFGGASRLIQKWRRLVMFFALAATGAGVMVAAGGGPGSLLLSAFIVGVGYGPITPLNSQVVAEFTTTRRGFLLSLRQSGVPMGGMLAGALVPPLYAAGGAVLVYSAVLAGCVLAGLFVAMYCPPPPAEALAGMSGSVARPAIGRTIFNMPVMSLLIAAAIFGGAQMCLASYLVAYLVGGRGLAPATAGAMLSAASIGGLVCRLAWGALSDAVRNPILVLALNAVGVSAAALLIGPGYAALPVLAVWAAILFFGGNAYGWTGVQLAGITTLVPAAERARVLGISAFITFLGVVAWPLVFALLADRTGSMIAGFNLVAASCFGAAILLALSLHVARGDAKPDGIPLK